jgi:thiamine pyrophosphate-dependent enzyme
VNFAKIAEAYGCVGIRAEKPGEVRNALRKALSLNKPVVIDAVSDSNVLAKRVAHQWTFHKLRLFALRLRPFVLSVGGTTESKHERSAIRANGAFVK